MHRAYDAKLDRFVAVKLLHADRPISLLRFRREAHIVAQLKDPHIAEIYEFSEHPPFIAMRLIDGVPIDRASCDPIAALSDVARAVHRAHERGVVHRDLKPSNILVEPNGHAWVLDFGIAKRALEPHDLTRTGRIAGTPAYMSPEQALGKKEYDARTDVYGLGATLYHLLAGHPPHTGENAYEIIRRIVDVEPTVPDAERELVLIMGRAMARDPSLRYASAAELADDLDRYLTHRPVLAKPPSAWYRARKAVRRHPLIAGLMLLLALSIGALLLLARSTREADWTTVIREDFDQGEPTLHWKLLRGEVRLHDGALCSRNGHAVFSSRLGDRVRVEYTVTLPDDSTDPRELSAFISGSEEAGLAAGYSAEFFICDDAGRFFHALTRLRQMAQSAETVAPERRRTYRVAIERRGARIRTEIDGQPASSFEDPVPLFGPGHEHFGIGSKGDHLHFDDFEVRVPLADARAFAARSLAEGDWPAAAQSLGSVLEAETDPSGISSTALLHAEALLRSGRSSEAERSRQRVDPDRLDAQARLSCRLLDARLAAARGDAAAAFAELRRSASGESGRFATQGDRIRAAARNVVRRLEERGTEAIESELTNPEPTAYTIDLAYFAAARRRAGIDALPLHVQPFAMGWYDFATAERFAPEIPRLTDAFFTGQWASQRYAEIGMWAIVEGRPAKAPVWFDRSDVATKVSLDDPSEMATFGWAVLDPEKARARLARADNTGPDQVMWSARTLMLLDDRDGAREKYRAIESGWRTRADLYMVWEARLMLGLIDEHALEAASSSIDFDLPFDYAAQRSVIVALAHDLNDRRERAIEAYRAVPKLPLENVALRLLANERLRRLQKNSIAQ